MTINSVNYSMILERRCYYIHTISFKIIFSGFLWMLII